MQRPVSSFRAVSSSSDDQHVIDIMQPQQISFSLYNRRGIWPWRRSRSSRERCHFCIHAIPLVLFLCLFVLWWFSYPVNLEIVDGRLIAARKMELQPELVSETRVDYTILMKKVVVTPPPIPTPMNDISSIISPNRTRINDTSTEPPVLSD